MMIIITIVILINITGRVILEKSSGEEFQASSTPIHHVKWWINRFKVMYRALAASEVGLFFILLKGLEPLCNVTRSSVLVAVGVLYLPLHCINYCYFYWRCYHCIINITFIVNIIFIISIIVRIFIKSSLLFLWGKLTVWFCFFQFLHLS